MTLTIRPLTAEHWPALEDLFGENGACGGCWCIYWRIGSAYQKRAGDTNKSDFRRIVKRGPPPGLLAFDGKQAVGWCQVTPRAELATLARAKVLTPVDDLPVWALSCFYIRKGRRGQGIMTALIAAAIDTARQAGAPALEVHPWDTKEKKSPSTVYTGLASSFRRAGFKVVARRAKHRPVMRYTFEAAA